MSSEKGRVDIMVMRIMMPMMMVVVMLTMKMFSYLNYFDCHEQ